MRRDAAINEDKRFGLIVRIPLENLWRKIHGCSGAGADQLSQRNFQIAVFALGAVVAGVWVTADRPR